MKPAHKLRAIAEEAERSGDYRSAWFVFAELAQSETLRRRCPEIDLYLIEMERRAVDAAAGPSILVGKPHQPVCLERIAGRGLIS